MILKENVNVRGKKLYSFDDNHGVTIFYEMEDSINDKNEVGFVPVKHTFQCNNELDARNIFDNMFPVVPGKYVMNFEIRPSGKGQMKSKVISFNCIEKGVK